MNQLLLCLETESAFNRDESAALKQRGMDAAAQSNRSALAIARSIAIRIATEKGTVTADDVGAELEQLGIHLGPAAGSIFKVGFIFTGQRVRSDRKSNHARELKVWRLDAK